MTDTDDGDTVIVCKQQDVIVCPVCFNAGDIDTFIVVEDWLDNDEINCDDCDYEFPVADGIDLIIRKIFNRIKVSPNA